MRALPVPGLTLMLAMSCLLLAGCGFQPLYGGGAAQTLDNMSISVSGDARLAYLTETALIERTGTARNPASALSVSLRTAQVPLGVSADGQASRVALNIRASYRLARTGEEILSGRVTERVVFETPREPYALISARTNAERRAAEILSDAIVRDVLAGLRVRQQIQVQPDTAPAGNP
ncbi:MAG: lipopolysaccharide export system lipoprotein LptE [Oceanicaulis sp. HLUCCA04]|nr:MAG: lipopolysaccharide export system lipoprotein LptE [Oceanicaulis sp. HLUCCA04]